MAYRLFLNIRIFTWSLIKGFVYFLLQWLNPGKPFVEVMDYIVASYHSYKHVDAKQQHQQHHRQPCLSVHMNYTFYSFWLSHTEPFWPGPYYLWKTGTVLFYLFLFLVHTWYQCTNSYNNPRCMLNIRPYLDLQSYRRYFANEEKYMQLMIQKPNMLPVVQTE